jgi:sulfur carrier protein
MNITINDRPAQSDAPNLAALAEELDLPATGVAIAIGNQMIPRPEWRNTPISEGATLLIIRAASGG